MGHEGTNNNWEINCFERQFQNKTMILGETSHTYNFKVDDFEIKKEDQINFLGLELDSQ